MKSQWLPELGRKMPVLMLAMLAVSSPCPAEVVPPVESKPVSEIPVIPDNVEKKILGHMQETNVTRLKGWPGMIFFCAPDAENNPALKTICESTYGVLESMAAQHGVKFHKARNANEVALLPHLTGRLKLLVEMNSTDPASSPAAIAAHVVVLAHYTGAVNRYADLSLGEDSAQDKHPLNVPQHVDGILWESTVIRAASRQEDLVDPLRQAITERLAAFFADYAKANQ